MMANTLLAWVGETGNGLEVDASVAHRSDRSSVVVHN